MLNALLIICTVYDEEEEYLPVRKYANLGLSED